MDISLQVLLFIALLIFAAKAMGNLSVRVRLPLVLGELLAGVLLGPTFLNVWQLPWFSSRASLAGEPISVNAVFSVLAQLGVVILMFLAGLETDISMMKSAIGPAFWAATGGVVLPLAGGSLVSRAAGFDWSEAVFIGTILTATSVSITAQTLMNLGKLRTKAGSTILGAAVIDDVLGLMVLSLVIAAEPRAVHPHVSGYSGVAIAVGRMAAFLGLALWLGPKGIRFILRKVQHFHGPHTLVAAALATAFLCAYLADSLGGMAAITGSYLAGLFVAATPAHAEVIEDLRSMTHAFFGPLFFVSIGLAINAWQLGGRLGFFLIILIVAILGKVVGCGLGAWLTGFSPRDSLTVGVGMIPRGEVGLITASIGWAGGLISASVFSLVVVLVLVTTLVTPGLLHLVFRGKTNLAAVASQPLLAELQREP